MFRSHLRNPHTLRCFTISNGMKSGFLESLEVITLRTFQFPDEGPRVIIFQIVLALDYMLKGSSNTKPSKFSAIDLTTPRVPWGRNLLNLFIFQIPCSSSRYPYFFRDLNHALQILLLAPDCNSYHICLSSIHRALSPFLSFQHSFKMKTLFMSTKFLNPKPLIFLGRVILSHLMVWTCFFSSISPTQRLFVFSLFLSSRY